MGGDGKVIEADETYLGKAEELHERTTGRAFSKKYQQKRAIISLVERGGKVRSFHVPCTDKATVAKIVMDNISHETRLHTDESNLYAGGAKHFASHETVKHSDYEYARGDVTTNAVEGSFSVFKRGRDAVFSIYDSANTKMAKADKSS